MTLPEAAPAARTIRSRRLGVIAFLLGLFVFVASMIISIVTGSILGPQGSATDFTAGFGPPSVMNMNSAVGALAFVQVIVGSIVGIWAIVQGIIAVVQRRGRVWGVLAIVLAALAPGLSLLAFVVAAAVASSAAS